MTNEEAIEILQGAIKKPNTKDGYLGQAFDMAIKALEQEPCDDCISREEVLNTIYRHEEPNDENGNRYIEYSDALCFDIEQLSSVTPQRDNNVLERVKMREPCEDCISREDAMQIIRAWFDRNAKPSELKNEIEQMPSVTPQPKWILCSERLPKGKQQILISLTWDNDIREVRQGDRDYIDYWRHFNHITSIAWMPLPEPYREIQHTCSECIIKDTDACTRGNAEADEVACEEFVGGESDV